MFLWVLFLHNYIIPQKGCFLSFSGCSLFFCFFTAPFFCVRERRKSMFNNQRYATKGITNTVPLVTQIILWDCIDSMKTERKDYLQVFKLVANGVNQQVTHIRRSQTTSELSHSQLMNQSQRKSSSLTMKHIPLCFWQKNID